MLGVPLWDPLTLLKDGDPVERGRTEVRTERLLLRSPAARDADFVLTLLSDPRTTVHNPSDALGALGEAEALLLRWDAQWKSGLGYWIAEAEGAPIGVCGVKAVELRSGPCWNLLYRFLPTTWGHGYAREAAAEAVRAARSVDGSRPVIARVRPANRASARVAAAIGLERRPDLDLVGDDGADEVWADSRPDGHRTPVDAPVRSARTA